MRCFLRSYWYEKGIEHGNPFYNSRFRVNSPEASIHPDFMFRDEAKENGMMQILIEENLCMLDKVILYAELWGGHPGTANKRVSINGRNIYQIPEVGTGGDNCTHSYPIIPLKITDLVNGHNAVQFACDQGKSFWGHFIVDNACLMDILKSDHPDLKSFGLTEFSPEIITEPSNDYTETIKVSLSCPLSFIDAISDVNFFGYYNGYDENGNCQTNDWHGFTKDRNPEAIIGMSIQPPFEISWDVSMIPDQSDIAISALVRFKEHQNITYFTSAFKGLKTPNRNDRIKLYGSKDLPKPFWSRANNKKTCNIELDILPDQIEKAEMHVILWDGGSGTIDSPFRLNSHPISAAENGHHDVIYRIINIDPELLRKGFNEISLLSDTDHHGIEILLPGPALMIRKKI
ncbi:MAG: hypothetical protein AAB116_16045 [Candidatus Poribacteria bacterium]